jgi:acyl carrier protein
MIFEKVRDILCEQFGKDPDEITMTTSIIEDFDADSLDLIDLAMTLEDAFGMEVPDEELESIKTVGDIVKLIEEN